MNKCILRHAHITYLIHTEEPIAIIRAILVFVIAIQPSKKESGQRLLEAGYKGIWLHSNTDKWKNSK